MTEASDISALQARVDAEWTKAVPGGVAKTVHARPPGDGTPHVEVRHDLYDIVVEERGVENERHASLTLEAAAEWLLRDMAFQHALAQELAQRVAPHPPRLTQNGLTDDGYSRWNWMWPEILIMDQISPAAGARAREAYRAVLQKAPLTLSERRNARWPLLD
jgi:hypothetical protein